MELMHLIVDYQKRLRESSDSVQAAEDNARKFSMEAMFFFLVSFFLLIFMMNSYTALLDYNLVT